MLNRCAQRLVMSLLWCLAIVSSTLDAATQPTASGADAVYQLGTVLVTRNNIFDSSGSKNGSNIGSRLVNRLHYITREAVIRREVFIKPGDNLSIKDAEEIERNLRGLDLFSRVNVSLKPDPLNPATANLEIKTHDRLSIVASAGGSFLGGIGEVKFSVGDKNLLGLGHQLIFGYSENTEGELLGSVAYENVLVKGTDVYAGARAGQTEEGDFAEFLLANRFQHYKDNLSWAVQLDQSTTRTDYYEQGESIAEVPETRTRIRTNRISRIVGDQRFMRFGPLLNITDTEYDAPIGTAAATIDVPQSNTRYFIGGLLGSDSVSGYDKQTYLDTLSYEQDLQLGSSLEIAAGLEHYEATGSDGTDGANSEENTRPLIFFKGNTYNAISTNNYLNAGIGSSLAFDSEDIDSWSVSAALTYFNTTARSGTFAGRLLYESAFDNTRVQPRQTLGESNGLRGYPAREFNGEQKLLLNLEYRLKTPIKFASIELGGLTFLDTGWVGDRGNSNWTDDAKSSIGAGLRIGSAKLLGSGVIRLDVAYPLTDDPTRNYSPTFSLALGQVFGFKP